MKKEEPFKLFPFTFLSTASLFSPYREACAEAKACNSKECKIHPNITGILCFGITATYA